MKQINRLVIECVCVRLCMSWILRASSVVSESFIDIKIKSQTKTFAWLSKTCSHSRNSNTHWRQFGAVEWFSVCVLYISWNPKILSINCMCVYVIFVYIIQDLVDCVNRTPLNSIFIIIDGLCSFFGRSYNFKCLDEWHWKSINSPHCFPSRKLKFNYPQLNLKIEQRDGNQYVDFACTLEQSQQQNKIDSRPKSIIANEKRLK